jgi:hypothetical protein
MYSCSASGSCTASDQGTYKGLVACQADCGADDFFPLSGTLAEQYTKLKSLGATYESIASPINRPPDEANLPSMVDLLRQEMKVPWTSTLKKCLPATFPGGPSYAGQCKGDSNAQLNRDQMTAASGIRDKVMTFMPVYPETPAGRTVTVQQYSPGATQPTATKKNSPFDVIAELFANLYHNVSQYGDAHEDIYLQLLKAGYATMMDTFGPDGSKYVFDGTDAGKNITWGQYILLDPVCYTTFPEWSVNTVYNKSSKNGSGQFWGKKYPTQVSNGFEALAELYAIQAKNIAAQYEDWISLDEIVVDDEVIEYLTSKSGSFGLPSHDQFHSFRKDLRAFARIFAFYPQIFPTYYMSLLKGGRIFKDLSSSSGPALSFVQFPAYYLKNKKTPPTDPSSIEYRIFQQGKVAYASLGDSYGAPPTTNIGSAYYLLGSGGLGYSGSLFDQDANYNLANTADIVTILGKINDCIDVECNLGSFGGSAGIKKTVVDFAKGKRPMTSTDAAAYVSSNQTYGKLRTYVNSVWSNYKKYLAVAGITNNLDTMQKYLPTTV